MTNLPSLLKEGILEQDWSKVNAAYELLTGEAISYEQIVDAQFPSDEVKVEIETPPQDSHIAKSYKNDQPYDTSDAKGAARREPMNLKDRKPRWTDDGTIAAGEMVSKNPSLGVANPVARNRKPAQPQKPGDPDADMRLDQSSKLNEK
tara:strand:+ start:1315 stop:1758 length:444 start_codon:yes stop_codon:yes gene_type:complete